MLRTAIRHHQSGRLAEARALYQNILSIDGRHADALHLLGVVAFQVGQNNVALDLIGKAIAINGNTPAYHFNHAGALKALGRLHDALASYDTAVRIAPDAAETHFNRGTALQDLGRFDDALAAYDTALGIKPDLAEAHCNRGITLQNLGRMNEALAAYDAALRLDPNHVEAHSNRGAALQDLERPGEALDAYDAALRLMPNLAEAHCNRGAALIDLDRPAEAVMACDAALRIQPDLAEAHLNRGNALTKLGRLDQALTAYDVGLRTRPHYAEAHYNRGNVLKELGQPLEALTSYDAALRDNPDYAEAHSNRGSVLTALGRTNEALAAYDATLSIKPDDAQAHYNRGNVLHVLDRLEEALAAYDTALRLAPDSVETQVNRGNTLAASGRPDAALTAYQTALRTVPDLAVAHYNCGLLHLLSGRFEEGWRGYEYRWQVDGVQGGQRRHTESPMWQGEPAYGRTILLWAEQGFGDAIQFVRYVPLLVGLGWRVVLEVPPPLTRLFAGIAGVSVVAIGDSLPSFDVQCPLLSLPLLLATRIGTIPAPVPYSALGQDAIASWSSRLPRDGLRVGVVWQGDRRHRNDKNRSFHPEQFSPLGDVPGVHLVSLQKDAGAEPLTRLSPDGSIQTLGSDYERGDFLDTAAVIMALDMVIGADTAVMHLAGTLGRPVWVALPSVADWRWMREREDNPWYPTMRLFRQTQPGDWDGVFARIAAELRRSRTI